MEEKNNEQRFSNLHPCRTENNGVPPFIDKQKM